MSQSIKTITFEGLLDVWGVYNYNKVGKRDGHENHLCAKTFTEIQNVDQSQKRRKDYTSSRCLRHEIFKDLQPRQPSNKIFADKFIEMVASEVGLLRGYLSPDDGFKKCSPLHIADAVTTDHLDIVFDQGSSSKPKEGKEKNKKGEDKSDTSMFSKDNLPYRKQKLLGGINLKELQFLSLYGVDNDFSMINKKDKDKCLELLKEYFEKHGVDSALEIKKYIDKDAIYKVPREGILLNQKQIRHLVKVVFLRIRSIHGLKAGSRLAYQKGSLKVSFFDGEDTIDAEESKLKEELSKIEFHHFFKEFKEVTED